MADQDREVADTLDPDPELEPSHRERLAAVVERRLDPLMAALAIAWTGLIAYELIAPTRQRDELSTVSTIIWSVFVAELAIKLAVSGRPLRFLRRRWPAAVFLALPALRVLRLVPAARLARVLPTARVLGSSYRVVGTARGLLHGRLTFLGAATGVVILSGGQLLFLLERGAAGGVTSLGEALWWSSNLAITSTLVFEPVTLPGRVLSLLLSTYAVVVFASLAAALGAFFVESRAERATTEEAGEQRER